MDLDEAIDIVARQVVLDALEYVRDDWDGYPEIGEDDWAEIAARAAKLPGPRPLRYDEAYAFLAARAEGVPA